MAGKLLVRPTVWVRKIAAAGSVQGDATLVPSKQVAIVLVTGADGTKGVRLPSARDNKSLAKLVVLKNQDSDNNTLKVYPAVGDAIDGGSADAAVSVTAKMAQTFLRYKGAWVTKRVPYIGGT